MLLVFVFMRTKIETRICVRMKNI